MFFNFARFFPQMQAQLDTLLANEDCSLETILESDNILQEIKGQGSSKFADHLIKHPGLYQKMIRYVIDYEEEFKDKKTQIQYPFLSSEIFGSENQKLIDFLFESPEEEIDQDVDQIRNTLLPLLMSFLEQDTLWVTSAGYFSKTFIAIIRKRGYSVWQYLRLNPYVLSNFMKHLDSRHVSEIVEKLIILDTQQESVESFLTDRQELLIRIMTIMSQKSHCKELVDNISDILCEITSKSMNNIYYNNNEMLPFIEQIKKPEFLFSIGIKTQSAATYQVLINLVELMSKETNRGDEDEVVHNDQDKDFSPFERIISELPRTLLLDDLNTSNFENSNRVQIRPFGLGRMRLLKLITALLQVNDENINHEFLEGKIFQILQLISVQYSNNNQIHVYFDKIVRIVIESNQTEMITNLLYESNLLRFIIENHKSSTRLLGYIGMLTQMSNYLIEKAKSITLIEKAIVQNQDWTTFCETVLIKVNAKEKPFLCNVNPKQKEDILEEDNNQDNVLEILKKFNPYKNHIFDQDQKNNEEHSEPQEIIQEDIQIICDDVQNEDFQDQEEEDQKIELEYSQHTYWINPIDEGFAQKVLNDYN